jgi:mono/diheme cytochrome c family protein
MRIKPIMLTLAGIAVVAGLAVAGVIGWMVFQPGPYAFATGTPVDLAAYQGSSPTGTPAELNNADASAKGAYIIRMADCAACHTAKGGTPFAGGRAFVLPFGTIYTPNLTPDAETGIGKWTDAEFLNAVHRGIAPDGSHYYPAFPYPSYTLLTDEDALAIKAYLFSLKPVKQANKPNTFAFPYNQRWLMTIWAALFNADHRFRPVAGQSAEWNRGAYLVEAAGHCGECHTPRNLMMGLKNSRKFAGAEQVGWQAYNLTSDRTNGIGGWSDAQVAQYLSIGHADGHGPASGPMAEAVEYGLRYLKPEDIHAIVTYLRGIPAQPDGPPAAQPGTPIAATDPLGAHLFVQACAGCHLPNGAGRQSPWAALKGSHTVSDPAGTNLVQVLTQGTEIGTSQGLMFMHAFTGGYSDQELSALANYTIGQFGFRQGSVTPNQIQKHREAAPDKPDKPAS